MKASARKTLIARVGLFLMGLALMSPSLASLLRGRLFFQTYWGGAAFSPIPVLVGFLAMGFAIFGNFEGKNRRR